MSSKDSVLANIKRHTLSAYEMSDIHFQGIQYPDKIIQFTEVIESVGGKCIRLDEQQNINTLISSIYPHARCVASNLPYISIATINTDTITDPHDLSETDLAIVEGKIGVAENGCVWISQEEKERAVYFIAEQLIIVLDREKIVHNMHEAYGQLIMNEYGFGVFISGPSKTADIEQSLVIGAHGAKGVTILLK